MNMAAEGGASAVDRVVAVITRSIELGQFSPGQRLPEVELSAELGVGRPVLREAFARLRADGVVEQTRFRGISIKRLQVEDVLEMLRVCAVFEGLVAADAAATISRRKTPEAFERAVHKLQSAETVNILETYDAVREFQNAVFDQAANPYLGALSLRVHNPLLRQFHAQFFAGARWSIAVFQDLMIPVIRAIRAGDESAAERSMRAAVESHRDLIKSMAMEHDRTDERVLRFG